MLDYHYKFPLPAFRQNLSVIPDVMVMAMIVSTVTRLHPFDSIERYCKSDDEYGYLRIDWDVWIKARDDFTANIKGEKPYLPGEVINVTDQDVMGMSDEKIDAYLDWHTKTWVDEGKKPTEISSLSTEILDMFPIQRPLTSKPAVEPSAPDKLSLQAIRIKMVMSNLVMRKIVSAEAEGKRKKPVLRIGSLHALYRHPEELPPHARVFYDEAAQVVGVSVQALISSVFRVEQRIQKLWRTSEIEESDEAEAAEEEIIDDDFSEGEDGGG